MNEVGWLVGEKEGREGRKKKRRKEEKTIFSHGDVIQAP